MNELLASMAPGRPMAAVAIVEGVESRDSGMVRRKVLPGAVRLDQMPFPLLYGHDHDRVIGRIDRMYQLSEAEPEVLSRALLESPDVFEADPETVWIAEGVFSGSETAKELVDLVEARMLRGVSVGPGQNSQSIPSDERLEESYEDGEPVMLEFSDFQVAELSLTSFQAIGPAVIWLSDVEFSANPEKDYADREKEHIIASVEPLQSVNSYPLTPPKEWFTLGGLPSPIPERLTVTDEGRVYGYLAKFGRPHTGFADTYVSVPLEERHEAFHTKAIKVEGGVRIPCGVLTMRTSHAPQVAKAPDVIRHYDDTGYAAADVVILDAGDGYVVSGAMRTTVSPEDVRALEGANVSGDWRKDQMVPRLRLRAVLAVNVPGFPPVNFMHNSNSMAEFSVGGTDALVACFCANEPSELDKLKAEIVEIRTQMAISDIESMF